MGSVGPARRFDAHRALTRTSLPTGFRRTAAPLALSLLFRGPSQHPRTVPRARRRARRTMLPLLGFRALRHMRAGGPVSARLPASRRAACGVWDPLRDLHRRPSRVLRRGASMGFALQGLLLGAVGPSREVPCPLGVHRVGSPRPHGERADAVAFRASIPPRARSAVPDPEGSGAPMPSWAFSLQSAHRPPVAAALCSRRDPLARVGWDRRPVPPASQGLSVRTTWRTLSGPPALVGFVTDDRRESA
jgi:hypothetical protein